METSQDAYGIMPDIDSTSSWWQTVYAKISSFYGTPGFYIFCIALIGLALFLLIKVKPSFNKKVLIILFLIATPIILLLDMSGILGNLASIIGNWYSNNGNSAAMGVLIVFLALVGGTLLVAVFSSIRYKSPADVTKQSNKPLLLSTLLVLVLTPLTIYLGNALEFVAERKYYFISFFLLIYALVPFFMGFEGRKPQAREVVLIAVLSAITIGGRAVFFMLPSVDPLIAMVVICGVCFGVETGFLVGAMSLLVSGFFFGMGPWVPWQMFTYGLIGFMAGLYHKIGWLPKNKYILSVFGFLSALFIFGGVMDIYATVSFTNDLTLEKVLTLYITGIPVNLVRGIAAIIFLMLLTDPMVEKLERIKLKYGIIER
ncbi:MAG: ECF transporter S component [Clostridia bacterium]|nr:ECF transporter S component [Clostridia bacterium]